MSEINKQIDRERVLKVIALSVCVFELLVFLFILTYQQDVVKRTETPISEEMAKIYISNPERLKPNQRLGLNPHRGVKNQETYILVKEEEQVVPFPWKAWILTSVGIPIGMAFLVMLLFKAYFQMVATSGGETAEPSGKIVSALNGLNRISIIWFLLVSLIVIFLFWYIPEVMKYTGEMVMSWLAEHWWFPVSVLGCGVAVLFLYVFLHYRLRIKAMNMEMELAKFKFLQLPAGNSRGASSNSDENKANPSIRLLNEPLPIEEKTEHQ